MNADPTYLPVDEEEREELLDKIYASLMGFAIGDALGKGTTLMNRAEIGMRYPDGLHEYSEIIRDAHRSLWAQNEWSTPTQLMLLTIVSLKEAGGFDAHDMALKLKEWDRITPDFVGIMRNVIGQPGFENKPVETAQRVWSSILRPEASNEALGRAMVMGIWGHALEKNLPDSILLTHSDTRCLSAGIVIAMMARDLLWTGKPTPITKLEAMAEEYDERVVPYFRKAYRADIEDFDLDDEATFWYVRKTMCTALWAVHRCHDMEEALDKIISMGGSPEYNASLALGLMGLYLGSKSLPRHLEATIARPEVIRLHAEMLLDAIIESLSGKPKDEIL